MIFHFKNHFLVPPQGIIKCKHDLLISISVMGRSLSYQSLLYNNSLKYSHFWRYLVRAVYSFNSESICRNNILNYWPFFTFQPSKQWFILWKDLWQWKTFQTLDICSLFKEYTAHLSLLTWYCLNNESYVKYME